jgi:tRNA G18 (ribose-2'-O)-methylase SpoU
MERSQEPGEFYLFAGVGPHPKPWPRGDQYDQDLLKHGDSRNIEDRFRYLTVEAIRNILDETREPVEVAIENWQHDLNIGSLVRTSNAFNVNAIHIIGNKRWNQHGALMTDKYMKLHHHSTVEEFLLDSASREIEVIGIDNVPGALPIETATLPRRCILLFGNEGLGLTEDAIAGCSRSFYITQNGSVRSMNASAAGAIALYAWRQQS